MSKQPVRSPSRLHRFFRWWGDAISNAGLMVGGSRSVSHTQEAGGTEQYLGTALSIGEARRRTGEAQANDRKFD